MPQTASIPPYRINTHETTADRHSFTLFGNRSTSSARPAKESTPQPYIHRQSSSNISAGSEDVPQHTTLRHRATYACYQCHSIFRPFIFHLYHQTCFPSSYVKIRSSFPFVRLRKSNKALSGTLSYSRYCNCLLPTCLPKLFHSLSQ